MMFNQPKRPILIVQALFLLLFCSCTALPKHPPPDDRVAFTVPEDDSLLSRYAPVFVVENPSALHNLIGTPTATLAENGEEQILVDPWRATVYSEMRQFATSKGAYTNLIYRVHFPEIPGGLLPYYLGKGKNVGLIVVVTLDSDNKPILYTTVHTCGCYLAFVPTSNLPAAALPDGWDKGRQTVHSESLPGILNLEINNSKPSRLMILLRDATHRVKDIWLEPEGTLSDYRRIKAEVAPLASLEVLPLKEGGTTSFYETEGPRMGYVKESQKSRERLLMSWWAFDWRIGEDKKLGNGKKDGIQFYTSLKPWARDASDMRDFATFLHHWKWNL
jgi:hypothetical protein